MKLLLFISLFIPQSIALPMVDHVDLDKYVGSWFEVTRMPNPFQDKKGQSPCFDTTATYSYKGDGTLKVVNSCDYIKNDQLLNETVVGTAYVRNKTTNAKLAVSLAPVIKDIPVLKQLITGTYIIMATGPVKNGKYQWAVVGSPKFFNRKKLKYGWILSKDPNFYNKKGFRKALKVLTDNGALEQSLVYSYR